MHTVLYTLLHTILHTVLYTVLYTVPYTVLYTLLCTVLCTMYMLYRTLYCTQYCALLTRVQCSRLRVSYSLSAISRCLTVSRSPVDHQLFILHCTLYTLLCTVLYALQCTPHCKLYCTLYTVHYTAQCTICCTMYPLLHIVLHTQVYCTHIHILIYLGLHDLITRPNNKRK